MGSSLSCPTPTPIPSLTPSTPCPSLAPSTPCPSLTPSTPCPSLTPSTPCPSLASSTPCPSLTSSTPCPSLTPSIPCPSLTPSIPCPSSEIQWNAYANMDVIGTDIEFLNGNTTRGCAQRYQSLTVNNRPTDVPTFFVTTTPGNQCWLKKSNNTTTQSFNPTRNRITYLPLSQTTQPITYRIFPEEMVSGQDILVSPNQHQLPMVDGLILQPSGKYSITGGYSTQGSYPCVKACHDFNVLNPSTPSRCVGGAIENGQLCTLKSSVTPRQLATPFPEQNHVLALS